MKRREFIAGLCGTCVWPLAGHAQHLELRRVGVLVGGVEKDPEQVSRLAAFQRSLRDFGWSEGRNFKIDIRYTPGDENRTQTIAKELIELRPDVILVATTTVASTVQKATSTIPIVFVVVSDPIGSGLVQNLPRPGANVTGFLNIEASLGGKWLELLREIAPRTTRAAMMFNPDSAPQFEYYWRSFESAARNLGVETATAQVRNDGDIEAAIEMLGRQPGNGLIVMPDFFASAHRKQIISQANRHRVPAVYPYPFFSKDDGLISYGVDLADSFRSAGLYVDRILRGEKPAELPVQAPTKFELVINLKTAKTLGLDVPVHLQQLADEVIE
jgi:putative ABC transport system substrate-binding protein